MSAGAHRATPAERLFCTVRSSGPCPCPAANDHIREAGVPSHDDFADPGRAAALADERFVQGRAQKVVKRREAHHIVCIASGTKYLSAVAAIAELIKDVDWCINAEHNMIAMPVWGHTIRYYCDIGLPTWALRQRRAAPSFADLPMHNSDHNGTGYKVQVDASVKDVADALKDMKKQHVEPEPGAVADWLRAMSDHYRAELHLRGSTRCSAPDASGAGTHAAWAQGRADPDSDWYRCFSMAGPNPKPRRFPASGGSSDDVARKIAKLANAFKTFGGP